MIRNRWFLFPISLVYGLVISFRNVLFNTGVFKQKHFDIPLIGVGNLSVGGTGKSILVDYLLNLLEDKRKLAVLSRGYGRKTSGFLIANENIGPEQIGDEPYQFHIKYQKVTVAVSERRVLGIERLLVNGIDCVVLDDVFQHRWVKPGLMILTTTYQRPYFEDYLLPAGNLREYRRGSSRSDIIMVTKCPNHLTEDQIHRFKHNLALSKSQKVYFSTLSYANLVYNYDGEQRSLEALKNQNLLLVTGIAEPRPLVDFMLSQQLRFKHLRFRDHHHYKRSDFEILDLTTYIILTTQKDFYKLHDVLESPKIYYLSVDIKFLRTSESIDFNQVIKDYIDSVQVD